MFKPGKAREIITLQTPGAPGPLGQPSYDVFASVRAMMEVGTGIRGGHELSRPEMGGSQVYFTFTIRYIPGVKGNMRVVIGSRIFHITDVRLQTEGNARSWDIYAREVMSV